MTDNPYESPLTKSNPEDNIQIVPEDPLPRKKGHLPILGCLLGGCLIPLVVIILIELLLTLAAYEYDFSWGLSLLLLVTAYFLSIIGANVGMHVETKIRRKRNQEPVTFALNVKGQIVDVSPARFADEPKPPSKTE